MKKIKTVKINTSGLYQDKNFNKPVEEFGFKKSRDEQIYFYDGNNGDKWVVLEMFGSPIEFIKAKNLIQGGIRLFNLTNFKTYALNK